MLTNPAGSGIIEAMSTTTAFLGKFPHLAKRTMLLGVMCAVWALMVFSCSSSGTVWDDTIPPEQSTKIVFYFFEPTSYNGMPLKMGTLRLLTIPAGDISIEGNINHYEDVSRVRFTFKLEGAIFSCNLEGGTEYTALVNHKYDKEIHRTVWGMELYRDLQMIGYPPEEKLITFIPFDPPVLTRAGR
jgi:hypothetical protein